jgi:hypothetical protein
MGLLHGHRRSRSGHGDGGTRYYPTMRLLREGVDDAPTRYEPAPFTQRPTDPYEEWRAKRDAEGMRDQVNAVRWVYRQRGTAAAPTEREDAAAETVRWVSRYRGAGSAPAGREASGAIAAGPGITRERPVDLVGAQGG